MEVLIPFVHSACLYPVLVADHCLSNSARSEIASGFVTETISILKDKSLRSRYADGSYPANVVPFYLYGTPNSLNIDHILVRNPNIQLSAENVQLSISNSKDGSQSVKSEDQSLFSRGEASIEKAGGLFGLSKPSSHQDHKDHKEHAAKNTATSSSSPDHATSSDISPDILSKGAILLIEGISEAAMQPFQSTQGPLGDTLTSSSNSKFFFRPDREFNVTVYQDPKACDAPGPGLADVSGGGEGGSGSSSSSKAKELGRGKLKLGKGMYVDSVEINQDPFEQLDGVEQYKAWKAKLDAIGREFG